MKSTDNKKAPDFGRCGALMKSQYRKSNMANLTQIHANPNIQPLVIGSFSIRQDEDGRYCLNDLHKASGGAEKHKPFNFMRNQQTKDLIVEIEQENMMLKSELHKIQAVNTIKGKGLNQGTFVIKELVYYYAMWISAKFHLMVIRAYDALVMDWKINSKQTISPAQQAELQGIVARRSGNCGKARMEMWSRHNNHFKIGKYSQLLTIHFEDAKFYLENMEIKVKAFDEKFVTKPIDNSNIQALAIHMIWAYKWWDHFGGAIRILNPHMAGLVNEHFVSGMCLAYNFLEQPTKLAIDEKAKYYIWK